jgi:hypothetical protein
MLPMTRIRTLAALLGVVALAACEKNAVQDITRPAAGAFVRFQNYGVSAPGVNFYANEQKITAISSASCTPPTDAKCTSTGIEATTGVAYGASANGGNYSMLTPGQYKLSSRIAAAVDNGVAVSSVNASLADGKYYTYMVSGVYNAATKSTDAFVIEDAMPTSFDYSKAYIRIVNASANAPAISSTAQLQGATDVVTVATSVAYKSASQFVTIAPGLTDLTVTLAGAPPVTFKGVGLTGGHVFTLSLRGDATSTVAGNGLALAFTVNR